MLLSVRSTLICGERSNLYFCVTLRLFVKIFREEKFEPNASERLLRLKAPSFVDRAIFNF